MYNIWFHPLSAYPGPRLAAATRLYYFYHVFLGQWPFHARELHEQYGDVVRVAPNELSYATSEAWNEIYGFRPGKTQLTKEPKFYKGFGIADHSIVTVSRERHGHIRKQVSHGFSERALREQEPIVRSYADTCIERLKTECKNGSQAVNMVMWLNVSGVFGAAPGLKRSDCITSTSHLM